MTTLSISDLRDRRPQTLTPAHCHVLLVKASRYDGRTVGKENVEDWHEIAVTQRWTSLELAMAAITDYYGRAAKPGDRLWIMPGHVTEYVRSENRQPAHTSAKELESAAPQTASEKARADALNEIVAMLGRRKMIPGDETSSVVRSPKEVEAERRQARAEIRKARWTLVDGCGLCNDEGMRLDSPAVCDHPAVTL